MSFATACQFLATCTKKIGSTIATTFGGGKVVSAINGCVHQQCREATTARTGTTFPLKSLNLDPYNLQSEELALAECMRGVDVRRTWSEQELVRSFGGQLSPGTPDGMFETWDGVLTCVQVVRVPLLPGFSPAMQKGVLAQTVLCKVVKSQQWLRAVYASPQDFIIFCWLPFAVAQPIVDHAEELMQRVQQLDWRFSLRLRVPALPGALFPARFASTSRRSEAWSRTVSESEVSPYSGEVDSSSDEDQTCEWDITWAWEDDWNPVEAEEAGDTRLVDHG